MNQSVRILLDPRFYLSRLKTNLSKPGLVLLFVLLIPLIVLLGSLSKYGVALYHQAMAGSLMAQILQGTGNIQTGSFTCEKLPALDEINGTWLSRSIDHLQRSIYSAPLYSHSYLLLGRAYCFRGDPEKAITAYRQYIRLRPKDPLGYIELGYVNEIFNQKRQTLIVWKKAGLTTQDFISAGDSLRRANRFDEARQAYHHAGFFGLAQGDIRYYQGLIFEDQQLWDKALIEYASAFGSTKWVKGGDIYYREGLIEQKLYDSLAAIQNYKKAIESGDFSSNITQADSLFRYVVLLEGQGEPISLHIRELEQAINLDPYQYGSFAALGTAYYQEFHDVPKAISEIKSSIAINPNYVWSYLRLAQIYYSEKDWVLCKQTFTDLNHISPGSVEAKNVYDSLNGCNP